MSGQYVNLVAGDGARFTAFLATPASDAPGVVVLQEIFGVNAFVRSVCERLAQAGYLAIAPDLFWRLEPGVQLAETEFERAIQLMQALDQDQAVRDCDTAIDYLRTLRNCTGRIGAVGYCLGGKLAYLMAARSRIDAAVSYYGVGIQDALSEATSIAAPLLLHIAADDALCPPLAQAALNETFKEIPGVVIETYTNVGHAFARRGGLPYVEAVAERADTATLSFLGQHLGTNQFTPPE